MDIECDVTDRNFCLWWSCWNSLKLISGPQWARIRHFLSCFLLLTSPLEPLASQTRLLLCLACITYLYLFYHDIYVCLCRLSSFWKRVLVKPWQKPALFSVVFTHSASGLRGGLPWAHKHGPIRPPPFPQTLSWGCPLVTFLILPRHFWSCSEKEENKE